MMSRDTKRRRPNVSQGGTSGKSYPAPTHRWGLVHLGKVAHVRDLDWRHSGERSKGHSEPSGAYCHPIILSEMAQQRRWGQAPPLWGAAVLIVSPPGWPEVRPGRRRAQIGGIRMEGVATACRRPPNPWGVETPQSSNISSGPTVGVRTAV